MLPMESLDKGYMGSLYIISYNCMLIYNDVQKKKKKSLSEINYLLPEIWLVNMNVGLELQNCQYALIMIKIRSGKDQDVKFTGKC